ncbi:MAG: energy transducer TonB [Gammaproteobacteria bacterium]|nr:energy transducer TonB [Gammaproteobacteria bacterium]
MKANFAISLFLALMIASAAHAEQIKYMRYIDDNTDRIPTHTVAPEYPRIARRDRIEGEVQICYHVDKKGRPYRVAVRDSTHRIFERPALRAVKASSYKPLKRGEKSSGIKTCRTFRFELAPIVAENNS